MQLTEIIEKEKQRADGVDCRTLHFYKEGSFMRAYEYSAWLWCRYIKDFKPTHRKTKALEESFVHIGCPVSSFIGHIPENAVQHVDGEGGIHVELSELLVPVSWEELQQEFLQWKEGIPVEVSKNAKKKDGSINEIPIQNQPASLTSIMQRVLAFPIEQKSLIESVSFLSEIKQQLAKLV